jgi:hypothetical protein
VVLSQWLTIHSTGFHSPPNPPLERSVLSWLDYAWIVFFVFLITTRIYHLFSEVTLSRIFPWDAWLVWAYEARVWLEQGVYVEFLPPSHLLTAPKDAWVGATTVFYPKIIPALIFWLHQGTTEWLHVPVGLLWLWVAISISLMLFGLAQRLGLSVVGGMAVVYVWLSLPMVNTHIALFGYADLLISGLLTAVGAILIAGADREARLLRPLFVLLLIVLMFTKVEGTYWAVIIGLVLGTASLWTHAKKILMFMVLSSVGLLLIAWMVDLDWLFWVTQGRLSIELSSIGLGMRGVIKHAYVYYDWHLMFYLLVPALFLLARQPQVMRPYLSFSFYCLACLLILLVVLPLSGAQAWLMQSTIFSRIALQVSGPVVLFGALIFFRLWLRVGSDHKSMVKKP